MTYIHEFPHPRVVVHCHPTREQFTLEDVRFALEQEVHALEVDLYFRQQDGRVVCNHDGPTIASPTLEQVIDLILEKMGHSPTVHNDGRQFFLVLDPKADSRILFNAILDILRRYTDHLSTAVDEGDPPRGITVIISGGDYRRRFYLHRFYAQLSVEQINQLCIVERHHYGDEITNLAAGQPPFQWISFKNGDERGQVNVLHAGADWKLSGRYNVRVWDCALNDFRRCLASGVDQINCDRDQIGALKKVIREQPGRGRSPSLTVRGPRGLLTWRDAASHALCVALGSYDRARLKFPREIALAHLLADECLALAPAGALMADGSASVIIVYEGLSDRQGIIRLWHSAVQRLPGKWTRLLRRPQSLRYVTGTFTSLERFVTFDGRERRLTTSLGTALRGRDPAVAVGPLGRILIVYDATGREGLRYLSGRLNAEGELEAQDYPLIEGKVCVGHNPTVAVDPTGRIVVVYEGTKDQELLYVSGMLDPSGRIVGRRFSLSQGNAGRGHAPSVALDKNGRVVVAYQSDLNGGLWVMSGILGESGRMHGPACPLTGDRTTARHPTAAFCSTEDVVVLYEEPADHIFWYVYGPPQWERVLGQEYPLRIGMERR